jgi:hypothetical protein
MTRKSIILAEWHRVRFAKEMGGSDGVTEKETSSSSQTIKIKGDLWISF